MRVIDTHTHLNDKDLYPKRDELIKNAISFGVEKMIIIGFDSASSELAVEIAHEYPGTCFAVVGIHPCECLKPGNENYDRIEKLLLDECVVGLGEIGYDFHWDDTPVDVQEKYFIDQIKLADKYNKPIIIHMRDATEKTLTTLKNHKMYLNNGGIMHCYGGPKELVKDFVDLGFYISFGGPLTFKNAKTPKEAILSVPLDKLLFETDAP